MHPAEAADRHADAAAWIAHLAGGAPLAIRGAMLRPALIALAALVSSSSLAGSTARADGARSSGAEVDPGPPAATRWYGWHVLAVDLASIGLIAAGRDQLFSTIGAGGLVLGGPLVHLGRGHGGRAVGSLALRLSAPIVGGAIATAACPGEDNDEIFGCMDHLLIGVVVGTGVAAVIDALRSTEEVEAAPPVAPAIMVGGGGAQLGVSGRF